MNKQLVKYAFSFIMAFGFFTAFSQNKKREQGQDAHSSGGRGNAGGNSPLPPANNGNRPAQNSGNGNNRPATVAHRTGPGSFRTPVNGGNPVRMAYHGAPRYTSGVPVYGQRVTKINVSYRTLAFHGQNYRYNNGIFYRPVGSVFQVVFPPIGIQINVLPLGYRRIYVGSLPYYYYNGVFYNSYQNNQYVVVDPPLGAKLPELPYGAQLVTINGNNYYELDGTYYVEEYNINNEVLYTVVGVHGVLNDAQLPAGVLQTNAYKTLPADCRKVNINGQVLYLAPDGQYYQEMLDANGTISYQIVGGVSN